MRIRRWVSVLAAGGLVAAAAACSSSSSSKSSSTTGAQAVTTTVASSGAPITIGVLLPLSGAFASSSAVYGTVAKALGTSALPGTSTIDGHPVKFVVRDDLGTAAGAASATRQLLDSDKVTAIIGPLYTGEALAALPLIKQANVLEIALTGCPDCGNGTKYPTTFSVESDRPSQMPSTIALMQKTGVKKVAVLMSDDPTGQAYADAFATAAREQAVNIVTTVHFAPASLDLGTQAAQLKSSGADAVYLATAVPTDVANAAKALKEAQYEPYMFGNAAAAVTVVAQAAGPEWAKKWAASGYGKNVTRPNPAPQGVAFAKLLASVNGQVAVAAPIDLSAGVLDAFNLIKNAAEGTHSTDGKTLATWLEQNGYPQGIKADYTFTASQHNGMRAEVQALVQPGTNQDGVPLRAGESG